LKKNLLTIILIAISLFAKAQVDTVFEKVKNLNQPAFEISPRFKNIFLDAYLDSLIKFPLQLSGNYKGSTVVSMHIDERGRISNVQILKSMSPYIDKEVTHVLNSIYGLKPAMNNNQNVALDYVLTITFSNNPKTNSIRTTAFEYYPQSVSLSGDADVDKTKQVFAAVEKEPTYPGGTTAFLQFLGSNIIYPIEARRKRIQGRVILTFVVEKDGTLSSFKILRSPDDLLSMESLRVMKTTLPFEPGMQNGRTVRVQYTIPISFSLNN